LREQQVPFFSLQRYRLSHFRKFADFSADVYNLYKSKTLVYISLAYHDLKRQSYLRLTTDGWATTSLWRFCSCFRVEMFVRERVKSYGTSWEISQLSLDRLVVRSLKPRSPVLPSPVLPKYRSHWNSIK